MTGLYTFAVVGRDETGDVQPGLRVVAGGEVAAIVEDVDVDDFEGERLERNLGDREWLERMVRRHESTIEGLLDGRAVVPMRFGSIFSNEAGLRAMLEENSEALLDMLDRVRGRHEWGVRVHADRSSMVQQLAPAAAGAKSGGDYLRRRRAEMNADSEVSAAAARIASEVHEQLGARAERAVVLQPRQSTPGTLVTTAYLVPFVDQERFLACVQELQGRLPGISLELTGPWPAYSFIGADVGGPRG
jgi:hypothetical protein